MLRVEHLRIGTLPALTFAVADGECLAVEGPSGSGKTRLLRALADLDPASGHVFLDGVERLEVEAQVWRRNVRYVSSEPGWWTETARHAMPQSNEARLRCLRFISALGLAERHLDQPVSELSTGERQRLALIRSLIDEPAVLLLDEPTSNLDTGTQALVEETIRFQMLAGRTVLLASHDMGLIGRLAHARLQLAKPRSSAPREPGREEMEAKP